MASVRSASVEPFKALLPEDFHGGLKRLTFGEAEWTPHLRVFCHFVRLNSSDALLDRICQRRLKIPHFAGRKFPSPRRVVVYSFG
jgi:hypothetical protein